MINRLLTLDSRLPVVWQTPATLQIGFDPPQVVLENIDDRLLPILSEIHKGISDTGVRMLAKQARIPDALLAPFLDALEPALQPPPVVTRHSLVLDGAPALIAPAWDVLRGLGRDVSPTKALGSAPPGEILLLSHYAPQPHHFRVWLREDRPHTPIIFTDQSVLIGPRIVPGLTRCLRCHYLGDPLRFPHRVAVTSQLSGRNAPSATPEIIRLATWHALRLLDTPEQDLQLRLCPTTTEITAGVSQGSGECSCLGIA